MLMGDENEEMMDAAGAGEEQPAGDGDRLAKLSALVDELAAKLAVVQDLLAQETGEEDKEMGGDETSLPGEGAPEPDAADKSARKMQAVALLSKAV